MARFSTSTQAGAPLGTGDAVGLSALDSIDGILEPDVLPPSEVHAQSQQWAKDHPLEAAEAKAARGKGRGRVPLMVSTSHAECQVIPAKLFELWNSWNGEADDFEPAIVTLLQREANRHVQMKIETKGFDDFWAWESWFIDARTKDIRKCQSRESRPFASYTHALRHLT